MPSLEDLQVRDEKWSRTLGKEETIATGWAPAQGLKGPQSSYFAVFRVDILDLTIAILYTIDVFPSVETAREYYEARKAADSPISPGNPQIGEESYRGDPGIFQYPELVFRRANVVVHFRVTKGYGRVEAYDSYAKIVDEKIQKALR